MRTIRRAATLALLLLATAAEVAMATEEPKHRILERRDGFEVRLYEPLVVAETVVEGEFGGGGTKGSGASPATSSAGTTAAGKSP